MVHLGPLPGAPGHRGDVGTVVAAAERDAHLLHEGGCSAVLVENYGDAPFFPASVPAVTVAAMTRAVAAVRRKVPCPVGVNVLRNDGESALAIAAATGAAFIRVNVLSGVMATDQGMLTGRAAQIGRARTAWAPAVRVFADVFVKHAVPPPGLRLADATADLVARAGADAVIVSGAATGDPPSPQLVAEVAAAAAGVPVYIGSGLDADNAESLLGQAAGAIVGTSVKVDGVTTNPVDPARVAAVAAAVKAAR